MNFKILPIIIFLTILFVSCTEIDTPPDEIIPEQTTGETFYVSVNDVTTENLQDTLELAGGWLLNSLNEDGSMNYKYLPNEDSYPDQNNMIRQFMATLSLAELYEMTGDEMYWEAYERNLYFNIFHYYYEEEGFGYIFYDDMAKLGSAAIALMAVLPAEDPIYEEKKVMLKKFIISLHNETGKFRTFYLPPDSVRNQNFYPGEAMLGLMRAYENENDPEMIDAVEKSFSYYSEFFRNGRNPAFVPWHTMALYRLYKETGEQEHADFIFEMNDWLIKMQERTCRQDPRYLGRFYDPNHPEYGPPHSSSTAVYVEGLTYAYSLAKELEEEERVMAYRDSALLGIRSLMQLQFTELNRGNVSDDNWIKAEGGIRKTVEDPQLRIDNTQHTVMALIQALVVFDDMTIREFRDNYPDCDVS